MGWSCFFGGHEWDGCKCSKCGAVRDSDHKWHNSHSQCDVCGKPNFPPPESNEQAKAKIAEIKRGTKDAEAIVGRLTKAATVYWQEQSPEFKLKLSENEIKIVLGLLGNKCLVAPPIRCGKTTGIGLAALARYILIGGLKQIWIVAEGASNPLLSGCKHAILRDFLGLFGVELVNANSLLQVRPDYLVLAHKYANVIPVFEGSLPYDNYNLRDYWKGIHTVYLDNVKIRLNVVSSFSRFCHVLAVAKKDVAQEFQNQVKDAQFRFRPSSTIDEKTAGILVKGTLRSGVHDEWGKAF